MILTADAAIVRRTNRRETPTGWNTALIGANRYTIKPDEPIPAADALHPVAFLVEKGPGGVTPPHFHRADQYQVVVGGSGKLGLHDTGGIAVHYTDAYSAYGPIVAAGEGITWVQPAQWLGSRKRASAETITRALAIKNLRAFLRSRPTPRRRAAAETIA